MEESLKAAAARVPYDDSHGQWETTILGGRESKDMKGIDCIALVHIVYHRGDKIDLDVSLFPWHEPGQLYKQAKSQDLIRKNVDLTPVFLDAAVIGNWQMTLRTVKSGSTYKLNGDGAIQMKREDERLVLTPVDPQSFNPGPPAAPVPVSVKFTVHDEGAIEVAITDRQLTAPYSKVDIPIGADGKPNALFGGTDNDGPFELAITGAKLIQMPK